VSKGGAVYVADTSALIGAWVRKYPPENFPGFWRKVEALISARRMFAPDEVLRELEAKEGDTLHKWAKDRAEALFIDVGGLQQEVRRILAAHPLLVDTRKNKSGADPFVIALAMRCREQGLDAVVVTEESEGGVRIPDVCRAFKIPCINVLGLVQQEHWRFG